MSLLMLWSFTLTLKTGQHATKIQSKLLNIFKISSVVIPLFGPYVYRCHQYMKRFRLYKSLEKTGIIKNEGKLSSLPVHLIKKGASSFMNFLMCPHIPILSNLYDSFAIKNRIYGNAVELQPRTRKQSSRRRTSTKKNEI